MYNEIHFNLGFHHEHNRANRDDYVTINLNNVNEDEVRTRELNNGKH